MMFVVVLCLALWLVCLCQCLHDNVSKHDFKLCSLTVRSINNKTLCKNAQDDGSGLQCSKSGDGNVWLSSQVWLLKYIIWLSLKYIYKYFAFMVPRVKKVPDPAQMNRDRLI